MIALVGEEITDYNGFSDVHFPLNGAQGAPNHILLQEALIRRPEVRKYSMSQIHTAALEALIFDVPICTLYLQCKDC